MRNVELGKARALAGELIEPGSLRDLTAVAGEITEAEIVGVKKQDVGARRGVFCSD